MTMIMMMMLIMIMAVTMVMMMRTTVLSQHRMMGGQWQSERALSGKRVSHGRPGFHDCHDYHQDYHDFHFNDYLDGFHHESSILSI